MMKHAQCKLISAALLLTAACGDAATKTPPATGADVPSSGGAMAAAPAAMPAAPRPGAGNYARYEPAVIVDRTGFDAPMGAASLFLPFGWKTEGGVYWAHDFMCTNGYNFLWRATSPDGAMSLGISPQTGWAYGVGMPATPQPGCPTLQISSVRQYLEESVKQTMPGARVLDYRNRPDLLVEVGAKPTRTPMPMGEIQIWQEAGEVLFAFQQNGQEMRGTSAVVVQFQKMITDMSSAFRGDPTVVQSLQPGQGPMESVNAYAMPGYYATAPNGRLNTGYFEAIRKSIKTNPQWARRIAGHNAAIGRVALEESRKRSEMIARSNEEISRIRQETWNAYQESSDRRAREFGEALRGVETYVDADAPGGTVELSHMQDNAWRLNDGTYVLTDDPNFDPWRDLQVEGRKLEALQ